MLNNDTHLLHDMNRVATHPSTNYLTRTIAFKVSPAEHNRRRDTRFDREA